MQMQRTAILLSLVTGGAAVWGLSAEPGRVAAGAPGAAAPAAPAAVPPSPADPKADSKSDPKTEPKTEPAPDPKADPKADPTPDPKTDPKSDPKSAPRADRPDPVTAAALDKLFAGFKTAAKAGDVKAVAACFTAPLEAALGESIDAADAADKAAKELSAALDKKFGKPAARDTLTVSDLADGIRAVFKRVDAISWAVQPPVPAKADSPHVLTVTILEDDGTGRTRRRVETLTAAREGTGDAAGWRLSPREAEAELKQLRDRTVMLRALPAKFAEVSKKLESGAYATREDVVVAANLAVLQVLAGKP